MDYKPLCGIRGCSDAAVGFSWADRDALKAKLKAQLEALGPPWVGCPVSRSIMSGKGLSTYTHIYIYIHVHTCKHLSIYSVYADKDILKL